MNENFIIMISFCIACKNRSKLESPKGPLYLLPNCIDSIIDSSQKLNAPAEIIITDWHSTDWPLEEWLPEKLDNTNISYNVIHIDEEQFSLGYGRNEAARHVTHDILFFLDADMLITKDLILDGIACINKGKAFFPICCNEYTGEERIRGFGNIMISRANYDIIGKWWEKNSWGDEDSNYFHRCNANEVQVERSIYKDFIHQWHPRKIGWNKGLVEEINRKKIRRKLVKVKREKRKEIADSIGGSGKRRKHKIKKEILRNMRKKD